MSICIKNGKHEWQSNTSDHITCIHCEEPFDESPDELLDSISESNNSIPDSIAQEWEIECGHCGSGNVAYPLNSIVRVDGVDKDISDYEEVSDYSKGFCKSCNLDFDPFADFKTKEIKETKPVKTAPFVVSGTPPLLPPPGYSYVQVKTCTHTPQHVINGKEYNIYAGREWDVKNDADKYDIVLNLTGYQLHKHHVIPIPELNKWSKKEHHKYKEICLDWPDMGIVDLPREFWLDLVGYFKKHHSKVLMFCMGGHGRTGTAMASLMVLGLEYSPEKAITWIRENYCEKAIETWKQLNYVYNLIGQQAPPSKERKDKIIVDNWSNCDKENCICQTCMTNEEYTEYKKTSIFPESYKKREIEKKQKKIISNSAHESETYSGLF